MYADAQRTSRRVFNACAMPFDANAHVLAHSRARVDGWTGRYALFGSAISMILFGVFHKYGILLVCLFLNGAMQAVVFPQCKWRWRWLLLCGTLALPGLTGLTLGCERDPRLVKHFTPLSSSLPHLLPPSPPPPPLLSSSLPTLHLHFLFNIACWILE